MAIGLARIGGRVGSALRGSGVTNSIARFGGSVASILRTSGGGIIGGAAGGYSFANIEQWLGQENDTRRLLIIGGAVLLAMYSAGQLFDIQLGG